MYFCSDAPRAERVGRPILRSCSLESVVVRVTSSRDDVIGEQVPAAATRRTRGFNESFRAAVDRSYSKRQAGSPGMKCRPIG